MDRRKIIAASMGGIYVGACVRALWDRLDAVLMLAAASPVAAGFTFLKGANIFTRMLIVAFIDAFLAGLAFVPVMGDLVDIGASVVAVVLISMWFRQFATSLPGGAACTVLCLFLWFAGGLLPHRLSVSGAPHPFWYYLLMIAAITLIGGAIIAVIAMILGLYYHGDRAQAVFCTIGFPWYLITFFLTVFLPNRHVKRAHQAVGLVHRFDYRCSI